MANFIAIHVDGQSRQKVERLVLLCADLYETTEFQHMAHSSKILATHSFAIYLYSSTQSRCAGVEINVVSRALPWAVRRLCKQLIYRLSGPGLQAV